MKGFLGAFIISTFLGFMSLGQIGKTYVLAIGVSEYPNFPEDSQLKYAQSDAEMVKSFFELYNKEATITMPLTDRISKSEIDNNLNELMALVEANDRVVFYFAGHGKVTSDRGKGVLFLSDADTVNQNRYVGKGHLHFDPLFEYAKGFNDKGCEILIITDACQSGIALEQMFKLDLGLNDDDDAASTSIFLSSSKGQKSQESNSLKHGVFTYFLMEGLSGGADSDSNFRITAQELESYVKEKVKTYVVTSSNNEKKQTPQFNFPDDDYVIQNLGSSMEMVHEKLFFSEKENYDDLLVSRGFNPEVEIFHSNKLVRNYFYYLKSQAKNQFVFQGDIDGTLSEIIYQKGEKSNLKLAKGQFSTSFNASLSQVFVDGKSLVFSNQNNSLTKTISFDDEVNLVSMNDLGDAICVLGQDIYLIEENSSEPKLTFTHDQDISSIQFLDEDHALIIDPSGKVSVFRLSDSDFKSKKALKSECVGLDQHNQYYYIGDSKGQILKFNMDLSDVTRVLKDKSGILDFRINQKNGNIIYINGENDLIEFNPRESIISQEIQLDGDYASLEIGPFSDVLLIGGNERSLLLKDIRGFEDIKTKIKVKSGARFIHYSPLQKSLYIGNNEGGLESHYLEFKPHLSASNIRQLILQYEPNERTKSYVDSYLTNSLFRFVDSVTIEYVNQYNPAIRLNDLDRAIKYLEYIEKTLNPRISMSKKEQKIDAEILAVYASVFSDEDGEEHLRKLSDLSDSSSYYYKVASDYYLKKNWIESALQYSEYAESISPGWVTPKLNTSSSLRILGDQNQAKLKLEEALRLSSNNSQVYSEYANILYAEGDIESAIKNALDAVKLDSKAAASIDEGLILALGKAIEDSESNQNNNEVGVDEKESLIDPKSDPDIELGQEISGGVVFYLSEGETKALVFKQIKMSDKAILVDLNTALEIKRSENVGKENLWRLPSGDEANKLRNYISKVIKSNSQLGTQFWLAEKDEFTGQQKYYILSDGGISFTQSKNKRGVILVREVSLD